MIDIRTLEDKIQMLKIGRIEFTISVNDEGEPEVDYVVENMDREHIISDLCAETLEMALSEIENRLKETTL